MTKAYPAGTSSAGSNLKFDIISRLEDLKIKEKL